MMTVMQCQEGRLHVRRAAGRIEPCVRKAADRIELSVRKATGRIELCAHRIAGGTGLYRNAGRQEDGARIFTGQ